MGTIEPPGAPVTKTALFIYFFPQKLERFNNPLAPSFHGPVEMLKNVKALSFSES